MRYLRLSGAIELLNRVGQGVINKLNYSPWIRHCLQGRPIHQVRGSIDGKALARLAPQVQRELALAKLGGTRKLGRPAQPGTVGTVNGIDFRGAQRAIEDSDLIHASQHEVNEAGG